MTFDGEKWAKHHAWDIPGRSWRERIHHNIQDSNGDYAEKVVAELMKSLPCREFDGVLTENFETAVSDAAAFITECTQVASKGCSATALSLDLECGLGNPYEWACVAYAYTDSPFSFSQASLVELKASVDKRSWQGCFECFETEAAFNHIQLEGFATYRYVSYDSSQSSDYSRPIALALPEVMLGLKYKRFIGEAIAMARDAAPMWIITQGHDSFWMPTCFFADRNVVSGLSVIRSPSPPGVPKRPHRGRRCCDVLRSERFGGKREQRRGNDDRWPVCRAPAHSGAPRR